MNDRVTELLTAAIDSGAMPGAVAVAGTRDTILLERALGRLSYAADAEPVGPDTIYDLASLTKVVVTTPLVMRLHERGTLALDAPASAHLAEFTGGARDRVTVADLLAHCGGLLWWTDLYRQCKGLPARETRLCFLNRICKRALDYPPRSRTVYSDLGFILLGALLERLTQAPLDRLAVDEIFAPLGMNEIFYNPPESLRARIAPTEDDPRRGGILRGQVHDENAHGLGGVAPHAGLFGTARSLVPFAQMWLGGGRQDGSPLFRTATLQRFSRRANLVAGSSRALGWDTPAPESSCGNRFSAASFGHTGFTGTSLWIDPERDVFVILLANRVHPTRDNPRLTALRPAFHDAVLDCLTGRLRPSN